MSDSRFVWLTREQYNMLRSLMQTWPDVAKPIVAAWDAAPADAVDAVYRAAQPWEIVTMEDGIRSAVMLESAEIARRVLAALGYSEDDG